MSHGQEPHDEGAHGAVGLYRGGASHRFFYIMFIVVLGLGLRTFTMLGFRALGRVCGVLQSFDGRFLPGRLAGAGEEEREEEDQGGASPSHACMSQLQSSLLYQVVKALWGRSSWKRDCHNLCLSGARPLTSCKTLMPGDGVDCGNRRSAPYAESLSECI